MFGVLTISVKIPPMGTWTMSYVFLNKLKKKGSFLLFENSAQIKRLTCIDSRILSHGVRKNKIEQCYPLEFFPVNMSHTSAKP